MDTIEEKNADDDEIGRRGENTATDPGLSASITGAKSIGNGVFAEIGALPPGAIVNEDAIARIFKRHPSSIKKAVERGELPAPARMFGGNCWTAGAIVRHVEKRLADAAKEAERKGRIIQVTSHPNVFE